MMNKAIVQRELGGRARETLGKVPMRKGIIVRIIHPHPPWSMITTHIIQLEQKRRGLCLVGWVFMLRTMMDETRISNVCPF